MRKTVPIVYMKNGHCGNCCTITEYCDCELEKIGLYVKYNGKYKAYAYECLSCDAINKIVK